MRITTFTADTIAAPAQVRAALAALHSGTPLGPHSDSFELHGPFERGTVLTITPQGQDAMTSTIIELIPGEAYADQTVFGDLTLTFRHRLAPNPAGGTSVSHTLEITGASADEVGPELGPQISGDFPEAMTELLKAAESWPVGTQA